MHRIRPNGYILTADSSLGTTIVTPAVAEILQDFDCPDNASLTPLLISVHVIGFAIGPLVLSPASELFGRSPLMHASNAMFVLSSILSAASTNMAMLLVGRIIMGIAGCIPSVLGAGYIADLIPVEKRGKVFGIWACGPLLVRLAACPNKLQHLLIMTFKP